MDEPLILLAWTLGGTVAFGVVGALFGGLAAWLSCRAGHAPGSAVGRRVAEALARLREEELTELQKGTLTGAADGAFFLGLIGTAVGVIAARSGRAPESWLVPLFLITLALTGGALVFGGMAAGIVRLRLRAVIAVSVAGVGGALLTSAHFGVMHIVPGAVAGILLGLLTAALLPS